MAKKKSKQEVRHTNTAVENALSAVDLAAPIAKSVNLIDIFFVEFHGSRTPTAFSSVNEIDLAMGVKHVEIARSPSGDAFNVKLSFVLRANRKGETASGPPALEITCDIVLVYEISSLHGITDEQIIAFGRTSGVFAAWPFWREYVNSTTFRLSVPLLVLPTYRVD